MAPAARTDQLGGATSDVVDRRLGAGQLGVRPGAAWTLVATVVGAYGPALGSYAEVTGADAGRFTVAGVDVRDLMIRQVWGARVLQSGPRLPDCEANDRWIFTLLPGEGLTDGFAESGTVSSGTAIPGCPRQRAAPLCPTATTCRSAPSPAAAI